MEGSDLSAYADGVQYRHRLFIEADVQDLKHWRLTDIPGIDLRFAAALKNYHMETAIDVCRYFTRLDSMEMRETLQRIIPVGLWLDEDFQGNVERFIHVMEARVRHQGMETFFERQVVMFKESEWEHLAHYQLADIPGCNWNMHRALEARTGIKDGRQLYEQFRALGQDSVRMRAWLESHIPPECIIAQGMYSEGNLDHICLCLSERAKLQNDVGEDPPAAIPAVAIGMDAPPAAIPEVAVSMDAPPAASPEVGVTRSGRQFRAPAFSFNWGFESGA